MTDSDNNTNSNNWRSKQIWIKDVLSKSGTELMEITRTSSQRNNNTNSTTGITPSTSKVSCSVTTTVIGVKNGSGKKLIKKSNGQDSSAKMVYYPSTPLIVKTEQPSQSQFCTPLRATTPTAVSTTNSVHQQLLPIHAQQQNSLTTLNHNYNISHNNETIILQQHQQQQQQQQQIVHQQPQSSSVTGSINGGNSYQTQQKQNFLLTSIKTEQLPPSITLYATTSTAAAAVATTSTTSQPIQQIAPTLTTLTNVNTTAAATAVATATPSTTIGRKTTSTSNKPQFKCEQCGMTFGSKSAHTSHTKSHAKSNEMTTLSGISGGSMTQINTVEMNEDGIPIGIPKVPQITPNATGSSDPYQCNVCQKTFAVPARLIRHFRTHTGERPFECEFCHKLFSVKENLQVHRRIHTKERPYKCDVCGRAFEHSGKLHRHMRIHTGERPHKCSVCEKTFIQSGQLVIHMRTHTGEKPYKCPVEGCGKGFTCSKQLKVHSRTHTGEKPYQCDICYRDFGYNHVLKLHRVQHYGSKCYKCTICDKTFKSKKEMEAHIKGHANEMPDDDEETAASSTVGSGPTSSISSSGGETTNSPPGSPQSPMSNVNATGVQKTRKPRQPRTPRATFVNNKQPPSPSSPSSTYSPPSSMASTSRLSAGSPPSSVASPGAATSSYTAVPTTHIPETDMQYNSRDSGVATNFSTASADQQRHMGNQLPSRSPASYNNMDDLPTDLSISQQHVHAKTTANYYQTMQSNQQASPTPSYSYLRQQSPSPAPISEALLEAATIARRKEEEALQSLQLNVCRSNVTNPHQIQQPQLVHHNTVTPNAVFTTTAHPALLESELTHQDDDSLEANELIAHYKRGDLARHGLHKRYAPVPKFESALLTDENLVRKVEAAIAPLRSSTESPERSSSPESDSIMLVGDRDVMTLPLRKRKLYMHEEQAEIAESLAPTQAHNLCTNGANGTNDNNSTNQKVMRMSSVIQFAKAS